MGHLGMEKVYRDTINIYIENINTIENSQKTYKNDGGKYTKLYNKSFFMKLTFSG